MDLAIETEELTRRFGEVTAVDSLNLEVKKGEIFAFLGPNGAGKSTTIKMLTTLLPPTEGTAKVMGYDVVDDSRDVRKITGVVPQQHSLYMDLTAEENLKLIGDFYEIGEERRKERVEEMLELANLSERRDSLVGGFSGGMKQRLSLAASLLHEPEIIFMDEPTAGLDPQTRVSLRSLTKELNDEGMTIIYCTHDMDEAEKVSDRVGIINKGTLEAVDTPENLKKRIEKDEKIDINVEEVSQELIKELGNFEYVKDVESIENRLKIELKDEDKLSDLIEGISIKTHVKEFRKIKPSLEDVFVKITGEEIKND